MFRIGKLRLSGNHTVTEYEMSGEPYSQKSGWIIHSNGCITVADPEGVRSPLPAIKHPMKMKYFGLTKTKLFHFRGIFKIIEIKSLKRTQHLYIPFKESLNRPLHLDV